MKYASVFFMNFYYPESGYGDRLFFPPLGIGYLSEYLEMHGIQTSILDMGTGKNMSQAEDLMCQYIDEFNPEVIAISLNSICFPRSMSIIDNVYKNYPKIPIVVGGPHASSKGSELLKTYDFLDYVIVGEGEKPLYQLCIGEKLRNIPGLCWRQSSTIHENYDLPSKDLSEFPFPKYEKFQLTLYGNPDAIGILTSRGCPYKCIFCQQSSLLGKTWRGRTPEGIVDEIRYWKTQGKKTVHIIDDNFAMNRQRLLKISDLVVKDGLEDIEYVLVGGIRVNQVDEEILLALKRMGVKVIPLGVESGSDKILKFMRKGITSEQADIAINLSTSMGFDVKLFFIIGFPTETMEDVQMSFDLALKYPIASVRFFNLVPYPDTALMSWLEKNNGHFFYEFDEYMSNFKRFQRIPIFECSEGMNREEKLKAFEMADEVVRIIENNHKKRTKYLRKRFGIDEDK